MVSNASKSLLPPIQTNEFLPSISPWISVGTLTVVGAVTLAVPVAAISKYKVTVRGQATVRPQGELKLVQSATQGQITQIFVKPGQMVKKGDVIATIDQSRLLTQKNQLETTIAQQRLQLTQFAAQINSLEGQIAAVMSQSQSTVAAAEAQLSGNRREYADKQIAAIAEVEEKQAKLRSVQATLESAQVKQSRYASVAAEGALPKDKLAEAQLDVQQQQQELAVTRSQLRRAQAMLNPSTAELEMTQQRIAEAIHSGQASLAALKREKATLIQQRIDLNKQLQQGMRELQQVETELRQTTVRATEEGTLLQLKLHNPGQMLQPGEEIAQIVPSNASLNIRAAVSPQDIGKLAVGQKAQMRVSACPYSDYGTLNGVVSQISQDTMKPQPNPAATNPAESAAPAVYQVTITPDTRSLGRGERQCALQVGMEGKAEMITKEETVLQFLLRKARLMADV